MKRIVVGTDMSPRSEGAVEVAVQLASAMGATVHLVTAYASPTVGMGPEVMVVPNHAELAEGTKVDLEAMAASLRAKGLAVEIHPCMGDAVTALCSVAEAVDADLIVVGNKGMHGAARVLGSVPNKVAHKASCNVLIARTA